MNYNQNLTGGKKYMKLKFKPMIMMLMALIFLFAAAGCSASTTSKSTATPIAATTKPTTAASPTAAATTSPVATSTAATECTETESTSTITIEGQSEEVKVITHACKNGFKISYYPDYVTKTETDDALKFTATDSTTMGLEIAKSTLSLDQALEQIKTDNDITDTAEETTIGAGSYAASQLTVTEGTSQASLITNYYVLEQGGTVYVIKLAYTVEAEEGMGARLMAMLDTLTF
jgi:hypothetical protein